MSEMSDAIRALSADKDLGEDSIKQIIESMIVAAYQKAFGKGYDNCLVEFSKDMSEVKVYAQKTVIDGVYDPVIEIEPDEAEKFCPGCQVGDQVKIPIDPKKDFRRGAVSVGKQEAHKTFNESSTNKLMAEYTKKKGEVVVGQYQREQRGSIYIKLDSKVEGVLPQKFQSPRETFTGRDTFGQAERIKVLIKDVKKASGGNVQVILSRSDADFVKKIIELEVPEIGDEVIVVKKIVREAGYRTKIAVYSNKIDVDPVGACVGRNGLRIQNVIRELEGEKIDVLKYDEDPHEFIKNALSPAQVKRVVISDASSKKALAIVDDENFSIAIGKQGLNVHLASYLCDWTIDVKSESQVSEEDLVEDTFKAAEELFSEVPAETSETELPSEPGVDFDGETISTLPGLDSAVIEAVKAADFDDIVKFVEAYNEDDFAIEGVTKEQLDKIYEVINEHVEFVDDEAEPEEEVAAESAEDEAEESAEEKYFCPECNCEITTDMTECPNCHTEFSFEEE